MVEYAQYLKRGVMMVDPNGFGKSLAIEPPHLPEESDPNYRGHLREARVCYNPKDIEALLAVRRAFEAVGCNVSGTPVTGLVEPVINLDTRREGQFYSQEYLGVRQVQQVVKYIGDLDIPQAQNNFT
jgi:hypothetical protein